MGLRNALLRIGTGHPAVLPAVCRGGTETRLALEAELRRRGWPVAASPAAASGLVVAGTGGPADGEWVEALWRQIPSPKARSAAAGAYDVEAALDALLHPAPALVAAGGGGRPAGHVGHGVHEEHGHPHGGHEGHGGQAEHHLHGGTVAGLPLAGRADDRDGLRLDRLHLPLGPGLADWPAGLVLDVALQGDVVQHAGVRTLPPPAAGGLPYWDEPWLRAARGEYVARGAARRRSCAAHLDSVARLLAVSGWADPAARARRLRDAVRCGAPAREWGAGLERLVRRVRRSRVLRQLTAGLGALPAARARRFGVTGPALAADGDAYDRLLTWLDEAARGAAGVGDERPLAPSGQQGPRGRIDGHRPPSAALLAALPELVRGAEFASARVIVASLDPDLDEVGAVGDG